MSTRFRWALVKSKLTGANGRVTRIVLEGISTMPMSSQYRGDTNVVRYDPTTIWLHWLTLGAIIILWLIGQTADWVPRGPFRGLSMWCSDSSQASCSSRVSPGERISGAPWRRPTRAFSMQSQK